METKKIVEILKQVDSNLFLKVKFFKAVLADLLYEYEVEQKILNTINSSVNVVERLHRSSNKLLEYQSIKKELKSYGLNDDTIDWGLTIWSTVLDINVGRNLAQNQSIKISVGSSFTLLSNLSNQVYSWGNNKWGQLGNGTTKDSLTPKEITQYLKLGLDEEIVDIMTSLRSSYLYTSNGRVFSWGNNQHGQLGDGTNIHKNYPIEITNQFPLLYGETIKNMDAGGFHSILVTSLDRVFTWGNNEFGQLGDGTGANKFNPIDITSNFNFSDDEKIEHIMLGLGHSMLVTSSGRVYTWGNNEYGQLGDGSTNKKDRPLDITSNFYFMEDESIESISLGSLHTLIGTTQGRIFTFGSNESGQLGDLTTDHRSRPVDITNNFNILMDERVTKIMAARDYSLALTSLGRIFSWGNNKNGQIGVTDYTAHSIGPIEITDKIINKGKESIVDISIGESSMHSFAITSTGKVYAWGNNERGQIGEGTTIEQRIPIEIKFF